MKDVILPILPPSAQTLRVLTCTLSFLLTPVFTFSHFQAEPKHHLLRH